MPRRKRRTVCLGLRARAWWVIRKNQGTTLPDLLMILCDGSEKAAGRNLRRYLAGLAAAGILTREGRTQTSCAGHGAWCYRLANDLGPKAPVVRRESRVVFDPNSGIAYPMAATEASHE